MNRIRIFFLGIPLLTACAPMTEIDIRLIEPAELTIPLHIHEIIFLNRSIEPASLYHDTSKWSPAELYVLDTLVNHWIFRGVDNTMMESPLFDLDTLKILQSRRRDSARAMVPMSPERIRLLKRSRPADAAISLEYYYLKDTFSVDVGLDGFEYTAYLGFTMTTVWRIYDFVNDTVLDTHIGRDYLDWIAEGTFLSEALDRLPLAIDAIRETVFLAGSRYAERFSPVWQEHYRYFYQSPGSGMRKASALALAGAWEAASEIWIETAEEGNRRRSSMACYNLAVYYEMEDDLVEALNWAIRSYSLRQAQLTEQYIEILKRRYYDRLKLIKQLPAF